MIPRSIRRWSKNTYERPYTDALFYARAVNTLGRKTTCERNGQTTELIARLCQATSVTANRSGPIPCTTKPMPIL